MCLFALLPGHCLKLWLWLLLSPIAHIPNGKKKYSFAFQKHSALVCSCFQWEQGLARAQWVPTQSMLENKVRRMHALLLKNYMLVFQAQFFWLFLLVSIHPLTQKQKLLFLFPDSIAVLYLLVSISKLISIGSLWNSLQNCTSVSHVSNLFVSPVVLNAGLVRRIWLWNYDSNSLFEHQAFQNCLPSGTGALRYRSLSSLLVLRQNWMYLSPLLEWKMNAAFLRSTLPSIPIFSSSS